MATIPNIKPAGRYQIIVRLPGATPTTLSAYPTDATSLDGQLGGSPVAFTFQTVECAEIDQVPSTDGSLCVCAPGYVLVEPAGAGVTTTCEPCPQGFYRDNIDDNSCQACPANYFCPGDDTRHACPLNSTAPVSSSSVDNCVCDGGFKKTE